MNQNIVRLAVSSDSVTELLARFFRAKSEHTIRLYTSDLRAFSVYLNTVDITSAIVTLLNRPVTQVELTILHYISNLRDYQVAISTINRRVSTIRSLIKTANRLGLVSWCLDIRNLGEERKISPPDLPDNMKTKIYQYIQKIKDPRLSKRNMAILCCLMDMSLRGGTLSSLKFEDIDFQKGLITYSQGGQSHKRKLLVSTRKAVEDWIDIRGTEPGPLFINFDRSGKGRGLSETSIYRIVKQIGDSIGIPITPKTLRRITGGKK